MERLVVGVTKRPISVEQVKVAIRLEAENRNLLSKFVTFESGMGRFFGVIKGIEAPGIVPEFQVDGQSTVKTRKIATVENLSFRPQDGQPQTVSTPPEENQRVMLANTEDFEEFLPSHGTPNRGFAGLLQESSYPLPLDMDWLCFANSMVLAGINHGKSYLATMLAFQLFLEKKTVIVIDPTGAWKTSVGMVFEEYRKGLEAREKEVKSPTFMTRTYANLVGDRDISNNDDALTAFSRSVVGSAKESGFYVLDLLETANLIGAKQLTLRRQIAARIEELLFREARSLYSASGKEYCYQTCLVVDEAHEFVGSNLEGDSSEGSCLAFFALATQEARKYGLGHIFVDQSFRRLSDQLEVQSFFLGRFTSPGNQEKLNSTFGPDLFKAVQRTMPGRPSSWVVYGIAAPRPYSTFPFEVRGLSNEELVNLIIKK